ncbi:LamG domain-containing protein [Alteromonas flava]|uniref:LamG domain-containing protein n=1 Tax=Alteromonas flava TaxID=2048003 RepID=UPI000C283518|nr:LamG domain-containing protein [Alteromonas flava]
MIRLFQLCCALTLGFFHSYVIAAECRDVFPDPAASYAANGSIEFLYQAKLVGSDGVLTFNNVTDLSNGNVSCDTQSCVAGPTNSANLSLPTFRPSNTNLDVQVNSYSTVNLAQGEYDDINVEQGGQLNLTSLGGTYIVEHLHVKYGSQVVLSGGTYWITTLTLEQDARIIVSGSEPVTLFVQTAHAKYNSAINTQGTADQLTLISYNTVTLEQGVQLNGFVYALNNMHMKYQSRVLGAVNTAYLRMESESRITYAPDDIETADFANTCSVSVNLPSPIGHWPFDVCSLSGNGNELLDVVGGNHGQAYNGSSVDYDGKYCQSGEVNGLGNVFYIPHRDTYHLANGSISLWVNTPDLSFRNQASAGGMGIFSKDSNGLDNGGHLTLWLTSSGALRARLQNTQNSVTLQTGNFITENSWHHLVVTWGANGFRLYIDGVQRAAQSNFTTGLGFNREPIVLGANAWQTSDQSSPINQLRDFYRGSLDDLKIFDQQLSAQQVTALTNQTADTCVTCSSNPELMAHWPMDLCAVDGSAGEIVDLLATSPGYTVGNASHINDGKFCQAGRLNGSGGHIHIPNTVAMALSSGSISMWINTPDLSYSENNHTGGMGLFSRDSTGYDNGGHVTGWLTSNGQINVRHQNTNQSYFVSTPQGAITENTWHHVVYSFGPGGMRLYVDGDLVATNSQFTGGITGNSEPLIIGATATISGDNQALPNELRDFYKGGFDDVRIYRNALSASDVDSLYRSSGYACTNCTGDLPVAFYRFEEQEYTGPGQIIDSSANGFDGDPMGGVEPLIPDVPISCRALEVPQNFSVEAVDSLHTGIDMNQVGGRGTISFWYRSELPWINGNARQLFDASRIANPPNRDLLTDKFFFFVLKNDGSMRLAMEDNTDLDLIVDTYRYDVAPNQWVHFAVSWDLVNRTASLHLNGYEQPVFITAQVVTSQLGDVGNLHVGDNGTAYVIIQGTDNSAHGQFDDVRIYNFIQTRAQILADIQDRTECTSIDHYRIIHPQQALTCDGADVTIQACANADCSQLATEPSNISLSPNGWQSGSNVTFTGSTTQRLLSPTAGNVTVGIQSADPSAAVECDPDCTIDFVDAGFEFFNVNQPASTVLPAVIAESDLGVVGIRAIENQDGVCSPLLSGTHNVQLSFDCLSAVDAPYSSNQCRVPFAGVGVVGTGAGVNSGTVPLTFDSNGEATLTGYQYADAGRVALTAAATIDGVNIRSGSTQLDSVPARIVTSHSAGDPHVAGESFTLSLSALGANNGVLPSYQPGQLQFDLERLSPLGSAVDGALRYADGAEINSSTGAGNFVDTASIAFTNGQYQYAGAYFEEVGTIALDVRDFAYLGETVSADAVLLGRFIPAYFDVTTANVGQFADSCSANFTYVGQPFDFALGNEPRVEVTAKNALGDTTSNYADTLWRLAPTVSAISFSDNTGYASGLTVEDAGNINIAGVNVFDGAGAVDVLASRFSYVKTAQVTEPFETTIDLLFTTEFLTDADGVCYQSNYPNGCESYSISSIQGTQQRYGRFSVTNTHGPESEQLIVPAATEYYISGAWRLNIEDSCTPINLSQASGDITITNASEGDMEHNIASLLNSIVATGSLLQGESGSDDFVFQPVVDSNNNPLRGSVLMSLEPISGAHWTDFLNVDWDQDGDIDSDDKPAAFVTFGIPRDNDRTIHWREQFD